MCNFNGVTTQVNRSHVLVFRTEDGRILGNAEEMESKAKRVLRTVTSMRSLVKPGLAWCDAETFVADISSVTTTDKKKAYNVMKSMDAAFKSMQTDDGLSFRYGNRFDIGTMQSLSHFTTVEDLSQGSILVHCLVQMDLLQKTLRKPEKHIGPNFIQRALGFSSHLLLLLLKVNHFSRSVRRGIQGINNRLRGICFGKRKITWHYLRIIETKLKVLIDEMGVDLVRPLVQLHDDVAALLSEAPLSCSDATLVDLLSRCFIALGEVAKSWQTIKNKLTLTSGESYIEICHLRSTVLQAIEVIEERGETNEEMASSVYVEFKRRIERVCKVCLNGLKKVESFKTKTETEAESCTVRQVDRLCHLSDDLRVLHVERELAILHRMTDFSPDDSKVQALFEESLGIMATFVRGCAESSNMAEEFVTTTGSTLFHLMKAFVAFASTKFSDSEENKDEGNAEGKLEDNLDGCGLGEGTGDKSTLEGVDSEDLFEGTKAKDEREQEEQQDQAPNGEEKNDDFVDFSDDFASEQHLDQERDDGSDHEEDDKSDADFEEGQADEENHKDKDDEVLDAEDWDEKPDDDQEKPEDQNPKPDQQPLNTDALSRDPKTGDLETQVRPTSHDRVQVSNFSFPELLCSCIALFSGFHKAG